MIGFGRSIGPLGRSRVVTVAGVTYLLRDDFTTAQAAPLGTTRTCEPGPETLTLGADTNNRISISGGEMVHGSGDNSFAGHYSSAAFAHAAGRAYIANVNAIAQRGYFALSNTAALSTNSGDLELVAGSTILMRLPNGVSVSLGDTSPSGSTQCCIIRTSSGKYLYIVGGKLVWVSAEINTNALRMVLMTYFSGTNIRFDAAKVVDLAVLDARFSTDYGLATSRTAGSVSAGQTFAHEGGCLVDFTITTRPSAGSIDVIFRKQDASNYWICRANSSGDLSLQEVVGGVTTQRSVAAGVVVNGSRIVVIADGATIYGYSANTLRWTYSSATNFQSATSGSLSVLGTGGVVSDLVAWPRTVTLPDV